MAFEALRIREYRTGVRSAKTNRMEAEREQDSLFFPATRMGFFLR